MALVALGSTQSAVDTNHPCLSTSTSDECSDTVLGPGGYGVVRKGDDETEHLSGNDSPTCAATHSPTLDTDFSTTVVANSATGNLAMVGSKYGGIEEITAAGQTTVFVG